MTIQQTALALGYRIGYIYTLIREGKLTATKTGRTWTIDAASVEAFKLARQS